MPGHVHFHPLHNPVKNYPWGSFTALNQLFRLPNPENQPQAEIWMGVHPAGCSALDVGNDQRLLLSDYIATRPDDILGPSLHQQFGTLPYLLKILSADKALSVQVHPDKHQAELGYARQLTRHTDDQPDYNDANHKPELVFALTPFQAMNGFRPIPEILTLLGALNLPDLQPPLAALAADPTDAGLEQLFTTLMTLSPAQQARCIQGIAAALPRLPPALATILADITRDYPGDIGIFAPLLLNCITLQPGEAMFLHPGTLHAYIKGTAVEVMASSDNVLRAGLTGKKINVSELIACTRFEPQAPDTLKMQADCRAAGYQHYPVPVADFQFGLFSNVEQFIYPVTSAEIVLCLEGITTLRHPGGESLTLSPGNSAFIVASAGSACIATTGKACRVFCTAAG